MESVISAATLQAAHEKSDAAVLPATSDLTVDPFPPMIESATPIKKKAPSKVDISDESAFPTLSVAPGKKTAGLWGAGVSARVKTPAGTSPTSTRSATPVTENIAKAGYLAKFQLPTSSIQIHTLPQKGPRFSNRDPEPTTLGEVFKMLIKRYPSVNIESASTSSGLTTFIIKGRGPKAEVEGEAVKKELLARLEKRVSIDVEIPAALRAFVIGSKGRTLKSIIDSSGAAVQIPSRDEDDTPPATENVDPDGPKIPVTISGTVSAVEDAKTKILALVSQRISKVSVKVDRVDPVYWPHINGPRGTNMAKILEAAGASNVVVFIPRRSRVRGISATANEDEPDVVEEDQITVTGDRDEVTKAVAAIQHEAFEFERTCTMINLHVSKRQHRFLVGSTADEILEKTGCSVDLPPIESPSEEITIRGPQTSVAAGLSMALEKANATPIATLDIEKAHTGVFNTRQYAYCVTRFILARGKFKHLNDAHDVQVYLPRPASLLQDQPAVIEIVAKTQGSLEAAQSEIATIFKGLGPNSFRVVEIDSLLHKGLLAKRGQKIKPIEDTYRVDIIFPPYGEDRSQVIMVYIGEKDPVAALNAAQKDLEQLAKLEADIKSVTLTIPANLHRYIIGQGGTTLNAIIGEEKAVSVSFGSSKPTNGRSNGTTDLAEDSVLIRGPPEELERVKKAIERIAEEAKNEEIVNSYVAELSVPAALVSHVVGKGGSGVTKLREELGVRVDFEDHTKGVKSVGVTIQGRKENVEEAKKRVTTLVARLADEITVTIPLPASLERGSLIGKQGTYLKRLETKYEVRINFPSDKKESNSDDENKNNIIIRGPKQGAAAAKKELVDLIEFTKEHAHTATFKVSTKSLSRIVGRGGAQINQIKEDTEVESLDVNQEGEGDSATVTLKGTKTAVAAAKKAILAIAKEVDDETHISLVIPREYHQNLIGAGGANIRDLISKAGGPTDGRQAANAVRFPRPGEDNDTVTITAPSAIAEKIKSLLEAEHANLRSQIIYGVVVPQSAHAALIGKGASNLKQLQSKFNVKIVMPGWKDYETTGEASNKSDLADAPASEIVKLIGSEDACSTAASSLAELSKTQALASHTISIPRKYHTRITQNGKLFRSLPPGTRITHAGQKPPTSTAKPRPTPQFNENNGPRIDDPESEAAVDIKLETAPLYADDAAEEGDITWVIESRSSTDADRVLQRVKASLELAEQATHSGWVILPQGAMPRIVGAGGAGLERLRAEGVEVEVVGRQNANQLTLIGTLETIENARKHIVFVLSRPNRR